jgi:TRAP-type C4-dicarboxylate transport system substrate-binding protein
LKRLVVVLWLIIAAFVVTAAGCAAPAAAPAPVLSPASGSTPQEPIKLVAAAWMPEVMPPPIDREPFYFALEKWMDTIEKETGGRVAFRRYPAESLVKESDSWAAVTKGICDVVILLASSYADRFPRTDLMALPNLFPNATVGSMVLQNLQDEGYLASEWAEVKVLWHATNSPADVGCRTRQIKTLEDWQGIKVAVTGEPETSTIKALGSVPVVIPKTEHSMALKKEIVDAAWLELNGQVAFEYYEVAPYRTICHGGVRTLDYVMNLETYDSLPPEIRAVFDRNSGMLWSVITGKIFDSCLQRSADFLNIRHPPAYMPPEEEFARWQKAWEPVYEKAVDELEKKGINGKALLARMRELSQRYADYRMGGYGSY